MPKGNIIGVDLNLDQEYLQGAVEEIVKAAIVQALGEPEKIVKKAVDATINKNVDRDGNETTSTYRSTPYLQWLAEKTIEKTVREAMNETIQKNSESFKEEIIRQISTVKFRDDLVTAFIDTLLKTAGADYNMPISVSFSKQKADEY